MNRLAKSVCWTTGPLFLELNVAIDSGAMSQPGKRRAGLRSFLFQFPFLVLASAPPFPGASTLHPSNHWHACSGWDQIHAWCIHLRISLPGWGRGQTHVHPHHFWGAPRLPLRLCFGPAGSHLAEKLASPIGH